MTTPRLDRLQGPTYKIKVVLPDRTEKIYLTINHQDGRPFEVFIRVDRPELHEWVTSKALDISRRLQLGDSLANIAAEMLSTHSGGHSLHVMPDGRQCYSLVERIGRQLDEHARNIQ